MRCPAPTTVRGRSRRALARPPHEGRSSPAGRGLARPTVTGPTRAARGARAGARGRPCYLCPSPRVTRPRAAKVRDGNARDREHARCRDPGGRYLAEQQDIARRRRRPAPGGGDAATLRGWADTGTSVPRHPTTRTCSSVNALDRSRVRARGRACRTLCRRRVAP
jgi:hypothetical protein